MNTPHEIAFLGDTKAKILHSLLEGSKTAVEIAQKLRIQKSAVRAHLNSMQTEGLVRSYFKIQKHGRPKKIYELTEMGHESFPRKYDLILVPILKKLEEMNGSGQLRKVMESIADDLAVEIKDKIQKNNGSDKLGISLNVLNSISNEIGFVSSIVKEGEMFSVISRNCIVHKAALSNQDAICNGFHTRMIEQTLNGKFNINVQLKDCIALGNKHSRHVIAQM